MRQGFLFKKFKNSDCPHPPYTVRFLCFPINNSASLLYSHRLISVLCAKIQPWLNFGGKSGKRGRKKKEKEGECFLINRFSIALHHF
jgi:hypothetical protein